MPAMRFKWWIIISVGLFGIGMAGGLEAITDRRCKAAAAPLGMQESTLRSRWTRVRDRLRRCVAGKTGEVLAPETESRDPCIGRP